MSNGIWYGRLFWTILIVSMLLFGLVFIIHGNTENGVRELIRWSARISFSLFCVAFSASSLHKHVTSSFSWYLLMNRKFLGMAFAVIHLLHLAFIFWLQMKFHPVFELAVTSSLIGGGIAYFFVCIMLITSFEKPKAWISSSSWKWIHTIGGYWIWSIFMTTYWKRTDSESIHWIPVLILLSVIAIRVSTLPGFIYKVRR